MGFGTTVRQLRKDQGLSLRDLADRVGIDFTYLSKLELEQMNPPSDKVIRSLAQELDQDEEELLALAAKVSQAQLRNVVAHMPEAGMLFRKLQSGQLNRSQIERMLEIAQEDEKKSESVPRH